MHPVIRILNLLVLAALAWQLCALGLGAWWFFARKSGPASVPATAGITAEEIKAEIKTFLSVEASETLILEVYTMLKPQRVAWQTLQTVFLSGNKKVTIV